MLYNKKISLTIPCRNEEVALYSLLRVVPHYVDEVIVIDNNSTDSTGKVAKRAGAKVYKETREIQGVGYGFAHQKALEKAAGDYIVTMDGDNTYPVANIKEIITYMEKNDIDFVSCSRLPLLNKKAITPFRRLGIRILNLWIKLLYGYYISDILTGMWIANKKARAQLWVKSGDWNYSPEVKLEALYNRQINFSEYHIPYNERINGRSKLSAVKTGLSHLLFIFIRRISHHNRLAKIIKPITINTYKSFRTAVSSFL